MKKQIDIVAPDGSMQATVLKLLDGGGLPVTIGEKRTKEGKICVPWINRFAFQRPQEIPHYLHHGHFDVAIVGEDWIANWGYRFPVLLYLPIGRNSNKPVRVVLAVSQTSGIKNVSDLPKGSEIATEYVQLAERFFAEKGRPDICVVPSFGNTECKIGFGATGIIDVTESGDSLRENQLEVIHTIMESYTVVVANANSLADAEKRPYIDCFVHLVRGAYQASNYVWLIANVPENTVKAASQIIGGLKGPTCSPLQVPGWFALQSIVPREKEQTVIFELLQIGVTDIIVNRDIPLIMT